MATTKFGDGLGFSVDGQNYNIAGESDFQAKPGHTIEPKPTSGPTVHVFKKQIESGEGIKVIGGKKEYMQLVAASKKVDLQISYKDANSDVWQCVGTLSVTNSSSMSGEIPVVVHPNTSWS
jgi:hypothetical protein